MLERVDGGFCCFNKSGRSDMTALRIILPIIAIVSAGYFRHSVEGPILSKEDAFAFYGDFRIRQDRNEELSYEILANSDGSFGYNILSKGKLLIHQPHRPAVLGAKGFRTRGDAQRIAEFVIGKVLKGMFPPSVSIQELDSLGAL